MAPERAGANPLALLRLLHLSSPALPVGAYAYSQGLEYASEAGWLENQGLVEWLEDGLSMGIARLDLPLLIRVHAAASALDETALDTWNDWLLAARETRELQLEDQQIGAALWRLLGTLSEEPLPTLSQGPGYATAFGVAAVRFDIAADAALTGYCYSWLENQITAATKLVPLGQSAAQKILFELMERVSDVTAQACAVSDDDIGLSLPGLAIASARHERQHTRLFRS